MISWLISELLQPRRRSRWWYLLAVVVTIIAGLASRRFPELLPTTLGKYPGDALWALMVFFGWGLVFSRASSLRVAGLALATAYTIELLKLWQSPWWQEIRHSTAGHLVFGHAFSWQNFVAYAIGVACGLMVEIVLGARNSHN
jgi:hypothetical protein